ncbi:MAG: sulfite exporter TauE/SafE family protein [Rhodobacteraceae bacterium]|nr:sulfite exporter TauE/SafE family protein [Paracoccaceae bacterium]
MADGWPLIAAAVLAAGVLRGLTGFGFALAAVPLMSLFVPPAHAVVIAILLQCLVGLRDVVAMHGLLDRQSLGLLSAGALFGTPLGVWGLAQLSPDMLRVVLALLVGAGLLALLLRVRLSPGPGPALGAGMVSGIFAGLAAMPGPPAIAYFLGRAQPAACTRASLMVFFFVTALMALPGLYWSGQLSAGLFVQAVIAFPAMLLGTWAGGLGFRRLGEGGYRAAALLLLAAMALLTGLRGILGLL